MSSPKYNLMTSIKREVQDRNRRKYVDIKQQKVNNYYGLYQDKIVFIQRWWRKWMSVKLRRMETLVLAKISRNQLLQSRNQQKRLKLQAVNQKTAILLQQEKYQFLKTMEQQIVQKLKRVVRGTLDCAQKLAENNASYKYVIGEIRSHVDKVQELEGQISALKFEYDCHEKRRSEWQTKLCSLKESVMSESLKTIELRNRIKQISGGKMGDTISTLANVGTN